MTRILLWTEGDISGLADATGLSRILTEVDDNGVVTRELGFDVEGKVIYRHPGKPTCAKYGLFDLAKVAPSDRTEMDASEFERLWSA